MLVWFATLLQVCYGTKILILGGNGMLGSATVHALLKDGAHDITIVNRGNWYWDTETTVKPHVNHMECRRGDGFREECSALADVSNYFDVVIDFSGYDPLDVEDILILLKGKFARYIYISSDSVYEVSDTKNHDGYSKELDAVRPKDPNQRDALNKKDGYGHKKLACEEVLRRFHKPLHFDYVILRLPDTIGPGDNTLRLWKFYLWVKLHKIVGPVHIPVHLQGKPISLVYSKDVANLISRLVKPQLPLGTFNQEYNLAFREPITLKKMLTFIGKWIDKGEIAFDESPETATRNFGIPSVTLGPLDISKALNALAWEPSSVYAVLIECCQFYEDAEYNMKNKFRLDTVLDDLEIRGDRYRDFLDVHYDKISPKRKKRTEL